MHCVEAKGILSSNNGMNLYRGCTHGCIYCDSRSKCYGFTHDFEDIEVKAFGQCRLRDKQSLRRLGNVSVFFYLEHITENTCIHVDLRNRCLNDSISESERKIIKISGDALFLQSNKV